MEKEKIPLKASESIETIQTTDVVSTILRIHLSDILILQTILFPSFRARELIKKEKRELNIMQKFCRVVLAPKFTGAMRTMPEKTKHFFFFMRNPMPKNPISQALFIL